MDFLSALVTRLEPSVIAALVVGASAVASAVLAYLLGQRRTSVERKRTLCAEAIADALQWLELPYRISPNPPKGYGGGVDTGDDGYGKANGPGPVPIDGVEGSARWPRQWPGGGRQWRRPAKTARRHAGSGTGGLGWHEFAGQPQGLSGGRVGRRRRAVRLAGEWRAIGPGRN